MRISQISNQKKKRQRRHNLSLQTRYSTASLGGSDESGSLLHAYRRVHSIPTVMAITSEPIEPARHQGIADTTSLASIDQPPAGPVPITQGPPRVYRPFSPAVVALLMPASVFGVLARLGLQALGTYDGRSIFPLAYPQAVGCLIMGIALPLKDAIGDL